MFSVAISLAGMEPRFAAKEKGDVSAASAPFLFDRLEPISATLAPNLDEVSLKGGAQP